MPPKALPIVDRTRPLFQRTMPTPRNRAEFPSNTARIDLTKIHLEPFGEPDPVAKANALFDDRAAAAISAATGLDEGIHLGPSGDRGELNLLEEHFSGDDRILVPTAKCLAVIAYSDFFPNDENLGLLVSQAIMAANPGWCGTFGPGIDDTIDVIQDALEFLRTHVEGNYDMSQMHLLQIAYRYYQELTAEAQERLIRVLLATGRIRRPNLPDIVTSGGAPDDWSRAGFLEFPLPVIGGILGIHAKVKRIGETENHILTIHTARYLTNQLLYQRDHDPQHDNRRNGFHGAPHCTDLVLMLLRNILRDDFSEYNAKNYQDEARAALLNLYNYSYDPEVQLGARMVLDYISAHLAVSTNDLRRMVPFRRRNEGKNVTNSFGFMKVGLIETVTGADPMVQRFAILAGNTRTYETSSADRPQAWSIETSGRNGNQAVEDAISEYRLPPSIHDLFVNDANRRFFQRIHRVPLDDVETTGRNCDNFEIYAGSPSYLITAGGSPATYAIEPRILDAVPPGEDQQLGVAVTTSFMPTGTRAGRHNPGLPNPSDALQNNAADLIQFGSFSDKPGRTLNYGVAPDFACGHTIGEPLWCQNPVNGPDDRTGNFRFVNCGSNGDGPGFYLAIFKSDGGVVMEAHDTWLHRGMLKFEQFKAGVLAKNASLIIQNNVATVYTTQNGNRVHFTISTQPDSFAAVVGQVEYGDLDPTDAMGDAGNRLEPFLSGTILNSGPGPAVVQITNPLLGAGITLDMSDPKHPKRTSETGEVEEAGFPHDAWVDFAWDEPQEGDFFHPFNTLAAAQAAIVDGGTIRIMPGMSKERSLSGSKRCKLVAPVGGVVIGL